jgi:hypothetical protein
MDSFENLMKRLYGEKKKEDEPSIPPFDSLVHEWDRAKPAQPLKLLYRLMASSAAIIITTLLVLKYIDWGSAKRLPPALNNQPFNHYAISSTDRLLNTGNELTFIWNWKSPTDELLDLRHKRFKNK